MDLQSQIDLEKLPRHVAVIMDGNGRWAKKHGKPRIFGHHNGVKAVREITEAAAELGIEYLTLYAFSTENWKRPKFEVSALMNLLVETIEKEVKTMMKNDIRLDTIGDSGALPAHSRRALKKAMEKTRDNKRMTLVLALNYSARWEIAEAMKKICSTNIQTEMIDAECISRHLCTAGMPDPELLIRTSGEYRISNFLLWQIAYTELYFHKIYWPDFRREHLYEALIEYQNRERRFGLTSEQIH